MKSIYRLYNFSCWMLVVSVCLIFIDLVIYNFRPLSVDVYNPKTRTDSIRQENNKLILEINNLDSIKNAEVIEVKSINNDSTVKLFYQLLKE